MFIYTCKKSPKFQKSWFSIIQIISKSIADIDIHRHYYSIQGLAKDESTLKDLKVTKGAKIMVVGSTLNDVLSVTKPSPQELQETAKATAAAKEPLSQQKVCVYMCHSMSLS